MLHKKANLQMRRGTWTKRYSRSQIKTSKIPRECDGRLSTSGKTVVTGRFLYWTIACPLSRCLLHYLFGDMSLTIVYATERKYHCRRCRVSTPILCPLVLRLLDEGRMAETKGSQEHQGQWETLGVPGWVNVRRANLVCGGAYVPDVRQGK